MQLQTEIEDLREQIQHLEEALESLNKPGQKAPTDNSLVATLQARFDRLDSDVEREKSLKVTKTLLEEVKSKLQLKEKEFKAVGARLSNTRSTMEYKRIEINSMSRNLFEKLAQFRAFEAQIKREWEVVYGLNARRPIEEKAKIVLPEIKLSSGATFTIERLEID